MVFPVGSPTMYIQDAESAPTVKNAIIRQAITIATTTPVRAELINHSPIVLEMFPVQAQAEIIKDVASVLMDKSHIRFQAQPVLIKHAQTAYIKTSSLAQTVIPAKNQVIHTPLAVIAKTDKRYIRCRAQLAHIKRVQTAYTKTLLPAQIVIPAKNQAIHTPLVASARMAQPNAPAGINTHAATASGVAKVNAPKAAKTQRRAIDPT